MRGLVRTFWNVGKYVIPLILLLWGILAIAGWYGCFNQGGLGPAQCPTETALAHFFEAYMDFMTILMLFGIPLLFIAVPASLIAVALIHAFRK